jgi:hypothetical protein
MGKVVDGVNKVRTEKLVKRLNELVSVLEVQDELKKIAMAEPDEMMREILMDVYEVNDEQIKAREEEAESIGKILSEMSKPEESPKSIVDRLKSIMGRMGNNEEWFINGLIDSIRAMAKGDRKEDADMLNNIADSLESDSGKDYRENPYIEKVFKKVPGSAEKESDFFDGDNSFDLEAESELT